MNGTEVILPSLVLPECCGAVARASGDPDLGDAAAEEVDRLPTAVFLALTEDRARIAARLASRQMLRGADSIYAGIAAEFGSTLVTWDNEMLARARPVMSKMTPADWLAKPGIPEDTEARLGLFSSARCESRS